MSKKGSSITGRALACVLSLLLAWSLTLTGCGGGSSAAGSSASTTAAAETTAAETTAAETTAAETTAAETTAESTEAETEEVTYPYDFTSEEFLAIENYWEYAPLATISGVKEDGSYFKVKGDNGYVVLQGSCTDGTYAYMLLQNSKAKFEDKEWISMCILFKVDMATWEVVAESEPLPVDHGNSITYNSKTNTLYVSNASPNNHLISQIDPETLTVTDVFDYGSKLSGISYNEKRDQYVIRPSGTKDFAILDSDFVLRAYYKGGPTNLILQNIDSDDDYIYITDTSQNKLPAYEGMLVYDWSGNYVGAYRIDSNMENEGMFHVNDDYYMTFYNSGGRVYKVDFDKSLLKAPQESAEDAAAEPAEEAAESEAEPTSQAAAN